MLILQLPADAAPLLGPHRTRAGWEICPAGESLWLRCPDQARERTVALPCLGRFQADAAGRLIPWSGTLPAGRMPEGPWEALADWLTAAPPTAVLPGRSQARMEVKLQRSGREQTPSALLVTLDHLLAWAETAPRPRLGKLKFAVSAADGRTLVTGAPPPPVPGVAFYFHNRLLLPCGWDFAPPLWPAWVEQSLALPQGAVALLESSGRVEILEQESFAALTLAAVRRTRQALPVFPGSAGSAGSGKSGRSD
ncbi:MAG: hypothetical protein V4726_23075 [Verrucomicrobiota bacterium]